jgi:hypothetical protein
MRAWVAVVGRLLVVWAGSGDGWVAGRGVVLALLR